MVLCCIIGKRRAVTDSLYSALGQGFPSSSSGLDSGWGRWQPPGSSTPFFSSLSLSVHSGIPEKQATYRSSSLLPLLCHVASWTWHWLNIFQTFQISCLHTTWIIHLGIILERLSFYQVCLSGRVVSCAIRMLYTLLYNHETVLNALWHCC